MSLIPFFFDEAPRLFDLCHDLDDTMSSMNPFCSKHYYRPWRNLTRSTSRLDSGSKITLDKDKYQVCLDVQQFSPEEITVKTLGNQVVVEGKHEEKEDEHGFISRHFIRKYQLPEGHRAEDVQSTLSSDGVLSITAPRLQSAIKETERVVPITATGPVNKTIKEKQEQQKENKEETQTMEQ